MSYAPPTLATPRRAELHSDAARVAVVAQRYLGVQLWPWQLQVLETALELEHAPDTGQLRPRHKRIVCSVPRQSGKTELIGALLFTRMLQHQWVWYTAQTRSEAFDTFVMRWAAQWEAAPFGIKARRSAEMPGAYSPAGGAMRIFRPNGLGLHGKQADLLVVDEAWQLDYATGLELEQAAGPTGQTRSAYQKWIISTAGNGDSAYLSDSIASARELADGNDRSAVFIWDAAGVDPDDVEGICARHPATGTPVQQQVYEHLRTEHALMDRTEFMRAYGNVWPESSSDAFAASFDTHADPQLVPPTPGIPGLVLAVDASPAGTHATIVASWAGPTCPYFAVVEARSGIGWVSKALQQLVQRWQPRAVIVDQMSMALGPVNAAQLGQLVTYTDTKQLVAAAGWLADAATQYAYVPDPLLSAAAHAMRRRKIGERFAFGRASDGAPIDPLVAASQAAYAVAVPDHALVMA